jgi:hypothetical protein
MSRLIKIYADKEDLISKLKIQLYLAGISSIIKKSYISNSHTCSSNSSKTFELYIDNKHLTRANEIIDHTLSTS